MSKAAYAISTCISLFGLWVIIFVLPWRDKGDK